MANQFIKLFYVNFFNGMGTRAITWRSDWVKVQPKSLTMDTMIPYFMTQSLLKPLDCFLVVYFLNKGLSQFTD